MKRRKPLLWGHCSAPEDGRHRYKLKQVQEEHDPHIGRLVASAGGLGVFDAPEDGLEQGVFLLYRLTVVVGVQHVLDLGRQLSVGALRPIQGVQLLGELVDLRLGFRRAAPTGSAPRRSSFRVFSNASNTASSTMFR